MAVAGLTEMVRSVRYLTAEKGEIKGVGIGGYFVAVAPVAPPDREETLFNVKLNRNAGK